MGADDLMEIFTLVTGLLFLILEIRQSNWMWAVQVLSGGTALYMFWRQDLYASMALNLYYVIAAFWGLYSWRRDAAKVVGADMLDSSASEKTDAGGIHLRHISVRILVISLLLQIAGTVLLFWILRCLDDPSSMLDASVTVLSLIATWWLIRTYKEQWILWIIADALSSIMCLTHGLYWMTILYAFYAASAVYGYFHWTRNGKYVG